jgi:uncharacterized protein
VTGAQPSSEGPPTLSIGGAEVPAGVRMDLLLAVSESYIGDRTSVPITVVHGVREGPVLFVTAAVHGDELNGVGIVRDLLGILDAGVLAGAVICVPVVNVYGMMSHSRYLPDRRDLNRSFPGSPTGSTASRIAHALMTEVVSQADAGIDLHTATNRRMNVPQIRASLDDPEAHRLGRAFGAPYLIDAALREGSLRDAAKAIDVPVLTFEGGEAMRFEDAVLAAGVAGILRVMGAMGMIGDAPAPPPRPPVESDETHWVRADRGGILDLHVGPGDAVEAGQTLWTLTGPFGRERSQKSSPFTGAVIGMTTSPLVNPGDAVVHVAVPGRHEQTWIDDPTDEEDVTERDEHHDHPRHRDAEVPP